MKAKPESQQNDIQVVGSETMAVSHHVIPEFESSPRWVRAVLGEVTIADSKRMMILRHAERLPVYYFPKEDVRMDLLERTQHSTEATAQGEKTFWNIKAGEPAGE